MHDYSMTPPPIFQMMNEQKILIQHDHKWIITKFKVEVKMDAASLSKMLATVN